MNENNINDKVINIFARHNKDLPQVDEAEIKFFAGFNYIKIKKDKNGNRFNKEHLLDYADSCHYIVRVMKEQDGEVCLYNYDIKNRDLAKFIKSFENNTLSGTIIEIEKYFPEDLA